MAIQAFTGLSEAELQRAEQRLEAAAPGPWISCVAGRDPDTEMNCIETGACNELGSLRSIVLVGGTLADQEFIASARQDVPRLILEVRTLRAQLESLLGQKSRSQLQAAGGGIARH